MAKNRLLGQKGEVLARMFLEHDGYEVMEENWRAGRLGEVDLIVFHPGEKRLAFVEVKTRSSKSFGHPSEAVTPKKQETLRQLGEIYLQDFEHRNDSDLSVSFDVIAINTDKDPIEIEHLANAF